MRKFVTPAAAIIAVTAIALSGCTAADTTNADSDELESLSIMVPFFSPTAPEEGNEVEVALEELAGVDLDIRWVPNADYVAQTNVTLAGDDVPDVMVIQNRNQGFVQTAEAGGFWDLTDHIDDYPNLSKMNTEVREASSINGKVYGLYRARDLSRQSVMIRKDWLDNLGLEVPTTTEELAELARAFTEDDPDGNGADDTYGIVSSIFGTIGAGNMLDAFETWFGAGNMWVDDDGELIPSWETDEWKQALDYSRELYQGGYLNKDFATKDGATFTPSFFNGEGGIFIGVSSTSSELFTLMRAQDPENYTQILEVTGQLEGPNGRQTLPTAGYSGLLAVSKASVQTEEQLASVLRVLDVLNSEEATRLMQNGVEGVSYELVDGYADYDPEQQAVTDLSTLGFIQLATNVAGYPTLRALPRDDYEADISEKVIAITEDLDDAVYNPAAGIVSQSYITNQTTLDQIIADARIQYVVGEIDEDGLDDAIARWRSSGGEQVVAEYNELYTGK